jgi:hypothetical protein
MRTDFRDRPKHQSNSISIIIVRYPADRYQLGSRNTSACSMATRVYAHFAQCRAVPRPCGTVYCATF